MIKFQQFINILPIKTFYFIFADDHLADHHSRWQYMKHHRNVTAPHHTSSSPSLDIICSYTFNQSLIQAQLTELHNTVNECS